jgi:ferredoxin-type protein NapH
VKADTQRKRLLSQAGFFILFLLAPVFDLFRLDLNLKHFFFFGMHWTLGLDDFVAGKIDVTQAAINILLRGGLPIFGTIAFGVWISWKYGRLYCGWLCPHFSVVETINQLMRRTIGRQSLWDRHALPEKNADGSITKSNPLYWLVLLPLVVAFAFVWAIALLTYLLPPAEIYGNLWHGTRTRNQDIFLSAGTLAFFVEFMFARHLFCRYACAVGLFQSIAWMGNRKAMVIGFNRRRVGECVDCNSACDNICPMRLNPRKIKRLMFTCTQCGQCANACSQVQVNNPEGSLLKWVENECALDKSARDFGHHDDIPAYCYEQEKMK